MTMTSLLTIVLAIIKAVPAIDRWLAAAVLGYNEWKAQQDTLAITKAMASAATTNSTEAINDLIKKDMS